MGLFKRKPSIDELELQVMRSELLDLRVRLDAAEKAKAYLEARLSSLDVTTNRLVADTTAATNGMSRQIDGVLERIQSAEQSAQQAAYVHQRVQDVELRQDAHDQAGAELTPRLDHLAQRLDELAATMAAPRPDEAELRARLDHLASTAGQLGALDDRISELTAKTARLDDLGGRVDALTDHLSDLQARPALDGRVDAIVTDLTALGQRIGGLQEQQTAQLGPVAERVAINANDIRSILDRLDAIDCRIDEITKEVAGQLAEVSREMDELAAEAMQPGGGASDEDLDALRAAQVRLANEQARYQIAFRDDLALLAEQVRVLRGR